MSSEEAETPIEAWDITTSNPRTAMTVTPERTLDECTPAEAMLAGRRLGRIEAFREAWAFAEELKNQLPRLEDPRPLRQMIVYCRDKIVAEHPSHAPKDEAVWQSSE